jgi:PPOX class probable F420-dependent enzyme
MNAETLDQLTRAKNVSLTTFRANGEPVATPVGSVVSGGTLYVLSYPDTGKLKRLRTDTRVLVAPCDSAGRVAEGAPRVEGTAKVLDHDETKVAYRAMARKTALARLARVWFALLRKRDPWIGIAVTF